MTPHASARVRPPSGILHPSLAARAAIAWLTLLAIAGTLCACGRYGPPKRRPSEPPAATSSDAPTAPSATASDGSSDDSAR